MTARRHVDDDDEAARRRADRAARSAAHAEAHRLQTARESARAQLLVDHFVEEAERAGMATEELTARPWSGSGRYRTGVRGWYLRRDRSLGVGVDRGYYVLVVAPVRLGRWRTVPLAPSPPPLQVGRGARDGESVELAVLLQRRLSWADGLTEGPREAP